MSLANTTQLIFNTVNSNNLSTSNPQYYIRNPIDKITGYAFNTFNGINTFNVIDSRNNVLQFEETSTPGTLRNITIPTGNYTVSSLMTSIKTLMDAAGGGVAVYTVSLNAVSNLITIASTVNFKLLSVSNSCYYEIGFTVPSSSFAASQIASNIYDLSGLKSLVVISSSFGSNNSILINTNYTVIGIIPISTPFLGVITFDNSSVVMLDCQISELNNVSFSLLDERGRLINNGNDWSLSMYVRNS